MKKFIKIIMAIAVILVVIYLLKQEEVKNNPEMQKQIQKEKTKRKLIEQINRGEIITPERKSVIDSATQLVTSRMK